MKFSITIDDFIKQSKEKFDDRYCYDNMKLYKINGRYVCEIYDTYLKQNKKFDVVYHLQNQKIIKKDYITNSKYYQEKYFNVIKQQKEKINLDERLKKLKLLYDDKFEFVCDNSIYDDCIVKITCKKMW